MGFVRYENAMCGIFFLWILFNGLWLLRILRLTKSHSYPILPLFFHITNEKNCMYSQRLSLQYPQKSQSLSQLPIWQYSCHILPFASIKVTTAANAALALSIKLEIKLYPATRQKQHNYTFLRYPDKILSVPFSQHTTATSISPR